MKRLQRPQAGGDHRLDKVRCDRHRLATTSAYPVVDGARLHLAAADGARLHLAVADGCRLHLAAADGCLLHGAVVEAGDARPHPVVAGDHPDQIPAAVVEAGVRPGQIPAAVAVAGVRPGRNRVTAGVRQDPSG